jgi:glucose/arabinose dehydrogenase
MMSARAIFAFIFIAVISSDLSACLDRDLPGGPDRSGATAPSGPGENGGGDGGPSAASREAIGALLEALDLEMGVARTLAAPGFDRDRDAISAVLARTSTSIAAAEEQLAHALEMSKGDVATFAKEARGDIRAASALSEQIAIDLASGNFVHVGELAARVASAVAGTNLALASAGAGPASDRSRTLDATGFQVPPGYRVEIVAKDLSFVSALAVGDDGAIYAAESGTAFGRISAPARIVRIGPDSVDLVAPDHGFRPPIAGLAIFGATLFVSHQSTISSIDLATMAVRDIVTDLPAGGEHANRSIAIGAAGGDGPRLYFGIGSATNSGVVGVDDYAFGWLKQAPFAHDVPCRDLVLAGQTYLSGNPLTDAADDTASTGVYLAFDAPSTPARAIRGTVKCTGAILSAKLDGSDLRVHADGLRDPGGLAFHPDGRLFVTEAGPDLRGSRPVEAADNLYEVVEGGWYGFPDYFGGARIDLITNRPHVTPAKTALIEPPALAKRPWARFAAHGLVSGFDFARASAFDGPGAAFVAQFGDLSPFMSSGLMHRSGRMIVEVTRDEIVRPFLSYASDSDVSFRPTSVAFDPRGDRPVLYVAHFGDVRALAGGIIAIPRTGLVIRISAP